MLLFVYGTLKSGHRNNHYLEDQELIGEVETEPYYRLFDNGDFPMLVKDQNGYSVTGELWEIDEDILDELDAHEALYERQQIEIKDYEDEHIEGYIYIRRLKGEYGIFECRNGHWG